MAELRTGAYGQYYGCYMYESHALTQAQMEVNARYIYSALTAQGWTPEAIAGILGNMQWESSINPGRWQSDNVNALSSGYSLVQWTPARNYIEWCEGRGYDPSEMDVALLRIRYELSNGLQYYATPGYPLSFREFTQSKESPYYLACAFAWNYERSHTVLYGTEAEKEALRQKRGNSAQGWYKVITGMDPTPPPVTPSTNKHKMSLLLMWAATRRKI